jgi:anti-anti-sigma regulatory factor
MSSPPVAHIAYEQIDKPRSVIVEFLSHTVADPGHAAELGHQLGSLVRPDLPKSYLLDFHKVRSFSSTAFGALVGFILKVRKAGGRVVICNMGEFVRFGADIIRLGEYAPIASDRQAALDRLAGDELQTATGAGS